MINAIEVYVIFISSATTCENHCSVWKQVLLLYLTTRTMSLVKNIKSKRPKAVPCGTPWPIHWQIIIIIVIIPVTLLLKILYRSPKELSLHGHIFSYVSSLSFIVSNICCLLTQITQKFPQNAICNQNETFVMTSIWNFVMSIQSIETNFRIVPFVLLFECNKLYPQY